MLWLKAGYSSSWVQCKIKPKLNTLSCSFICLSIMLIYFKPKIKLLESEFWVLAVDLLTFLHERWRRNFKPVISIWGQSASLNEWNLTNFGGLVKKQSCVLDPWDLLKIWGSARPRDAWSYFLMNLRVMLLSKWGAVSSKIKVSKLRFSFFFRFESFLSLTKQQFKIRRVAQIKPINNFLKR